MNKWKLAVAFAAVAAIAGGGAALAARHFDSPNSESQAIINDAASRLNVSPTALSNALKSALEDRIDAAVAAGRITKADGDALKARIEAGDVPLFFGHHGFRGEHHLAAAARYLGVTENTLESDLESGKTLAQVAQEKGKSVSELVDALVADLKQHLDAAVSAGRITAAQERAILADAKQHITDLVNGVVPARPDFFHDGFRRHDF